MTDYEKLEEEHRRKKIEYLKNKPADNRYVMHDIGEGFVIQDKLAHMNHEHENDYMLLNNMFGEERKVQEGYKTKEEFMELVNDLDRTVNGHLYNNDADLILSKQQIYKQIESRLDLILTEKAPENFKVKYNNLDFDTGTSEEIEINVDVIYNGIMPIDRNRSPFLEKVLSNQLFNKIMVTLNRYQDELETLNKPEDASKVDALIELKIRIMEEIHKDSDLKQTLDFM